MSTHAHHYIYNHQSTHLPSSSSSPSTSHHVYTVDAVPSGDVEHSSLCMPTAPSADWHYSLDVQASSAVYSPTTPVPFSSFHSPVEPSSQSYALAGALQSSPKLANPSARTDLGRRSHSAAVPMPATPVSSGQGRWTYTTPTFGQDELSLSRMAISESNSRSQHRAYLTASASASSANERMGVAAVADSHSHSHSHSHLTVEGSQMSHSGVPLGEALPTGVPIGADFAGGLPRGVSSPARGQGFPHSHSQNQPMLMHQAQEAWINHNQNHMQQTHARPAPSPQPNSGEPLSNIVSPLPRQPAVPLSSRSHPAFSLSSNYTLPNGSHSHSPATGSLSMGMTVGNGRPGSNEMNGNGGVGGAGGSGGDADVDPEGDDDEDFFDDEEFEEDAEEAEGSRRSYPHSSPTPELQYPPGTSGTPADFLRSDAGPGSLVNYMVFDSDNGPWGDGPNAGILSRQDGPISPKFRGQPGIRVSPPYDDMLDVAQFSPYPDAARPSSASQGLQDKGKRMQSNAEPEPESNHQTVKVLVPSTTPGEPPKKVKMHQCRICQKLFPRPSGLATHMNSHSGARPYKCPLQLCNKTFAVRSNARRHLRTHGISAPPASLDKMGQGRSQAPQPFRVGFEAPVVVDVHDFGRTYVSGGSSGSASGDSTGSSSSSGSSGKAQRLRWVPQSLSTRSNASRLRSLSPSSDMADLDLDADYDDEDGFELQKADERSSASGRSRSSSSYMSPGPLNSMRSHLFSRRAPDLKIAPVPLPPSVPSDPSTNVYAKFDERNSFSETGTYPYHPDQWRCMPGPG